MSVWGTQDPTGLTGDTSSASPPNLLDPTGLTSFPFQSDLPSQDLLSSNDANSLFSGGGSTANPLQGLGTLLTGGSKIGNLLQGLLGPLFGLNQSGAGGTGGEVGGFAGGALGSLLGPLGTLGGSALGDLLGSLIGNWAGGGVAREAKPEALVGTLEGSGNATENLLGKYVQSGINSGYDLSEPKGTPFNTQREGDILQLLTGGGLPNKVTATGFGNNPSLSGWKNINALQGMFPNGTSLNLNQVQQILPLISRLVNQSGHESLRGLVGQENTLAQKLRQAETY
jgi:hypothetical protein